MISLTQYIKHGTVIKEMQQQLENAAGYWKKVLERLFKTILYITSGGIGLRGHVENLEAPNQGTFFEQ